MPRAVHVLAFGIFAMVTSEFVVAGLMPQMAEGLGVTVPQVGYLITVFALSMAFGGPPLTVALLRLPPKTALMTLFPLFLVGNVLAATASDYPAMVVARVITGVASQAFFGVAISLGSQLTRPERRGRAVAVLLNGLMLGTLLGLPLATLTGERYGWRAAFWAISALTVAAALCTAARRTPGGPAGGQRHPPLRADGLPRSTALAHPADQHDGHRRDLLRFQLPQPDPHRGHRLLAGRRPPCCSSRTAPPRSSATPSSVRLADRHTLPVLLGGLTLNAVFLAGFALLARRGDRGGALHAGRRPRRGHHEPGPGHPGPAGLATPGPSSTPCTVRSSPSGSSSAPRWAAWASTGSAPGPRSGWARRSRW